MFRRWRIKTWHVIERTLPFLDVAFSKRGMGSYEGRLLIWGKFRRIFLAISPALARALRRKYGIEGGCTSCGASCNLLFRCPHWDASTHLCTVYEDRPNVCRLFPITPADLRDRNLVLRDKPCGFKVAVPAKVAAAEV